MSRATRALSVSLVAFVMVASGACMLSLVPSASAYSPVEVSLEVPTFAGTLKTVQASLRVSGGPAADLDGNYTYAAEIIASNKTGSSVSPSTGGDPGGVFSFNVTMPGEPQKVKLRVNVTSKTDDGKQAVTLVREAEIKVVEPIVIKATVYNTGAAEARNVTATFYADGILLGSEVFDLAAGGSKEIVHNWTWANIASGKHVVTVKIDDPNKVVEFSDGNNVMSHTIYVGGQSNPLGAVLTVGLIVMSVFVALTWLAKPQKKK